MGTSEVLTQTVFGRAHGTIDILDGCFSDTLHQTSPVAGFKLSNVVPSDAPAHSPSIDI